MWMMLILGASLLLLLRKRKQDDEIESLRLTYAEALLFNGDPFRSEVALPSIPHEEWGRRLVEFWHLRFIRRRLGGIWEAWCILPAQDVRVWVRVPVPTSEATISINRNFVNLHWSITITAREDYR